MEISMFLIKMVKHQQINLVYFLVEELHMDLILQLQVIHFTLKQQIQQELRINTATDFQQMVSQMECCILVFLVMLLANFFTNVQIIHL